MPRRSRASGTERASSMAKFSFLNWMIGKHNSNEFTARRKEVQEGELISQIQELQRKLTVLQARKGGASPKTRDHKEIKQNLNQ